MKKLMKWLLGFYLLFFCGFGYSVCCLNNQGDPVDWWIIVKRPGSVEQDNGAVYIGSNVSSSEEYINLENSDGALLRTLQKVKEVGKVNIPRYDSQKKEQLMCEDSNSCTLLYNDQVHKKISKSSVSTKYAHSKGILSFSDSMGIWIVHSLPEFPFIDTNTKEIFPNFSENTNVRVANSSDRAYGQIFFCGSFSGKNQFEKIQEHLKKLKVNFYPHVNYKFYPKEKKGTKSNLIQSNIKLFSSGLELQEKLQLVSYGRKYAKKTDNDIYDYYAKDIIKSSLKVQHWYSSRNKELKVGSVSYIRKMHFPNQSESWGNSDTREDHSKWAISGNKGKLFCIGDLNRETLQKERGGQLLCFENQRVWNMFHSMIYTPEQRGAIKVLAQESGLSKNKLTKVKKIKECTLKELIKMGDIVVCKEGQKHAHYLKEHKPNPCADV